MELKISITGKSGSERLVSIIQLGIITALENEIMSIEEAEGYLFNPFTAEKLEKYGFNKEVIDIIRDGCELEDIESLVPDKLLTNISKLKEQIQNNISTLPKDEQQIEKIIK